jgi:hypothetical protein
VLASNFVSIQILHCSFCDREGQRSAAQLTSARYKNGSVYIETLRLEEFPVFDHFDNARIQLPIQRGTFF